MTVAEVRLWGRMIGAVSVDGPGGVAAFEYTPEFRRSGIESPGWCRHRLYTYITATMPRQEHSLARRPQTEH